MEYLKKFSDHNEQILFRDRFNLIEIDEYVEEKYYNKLRENYPPENLFSVHNDFAMSLSDEDPNFSKFINNNEIWHQFISEIQSKTYVDDLISFFRINKVCYKSKWKKFFSLKKEAKLSFRFNISKSGGFSLPHTDSSRKLVSLVLFFVDDEWNIDNGGQVNIYKPKNLENENNWRNERISKNKLDIIKTIIPKKNKIYGFKKTSNSYHSVESIKEANGLHRKVFMINLIYQNKFDSPFTEKSNILIKIKKKLLNGHK